MAAASARAPQQTEMHHPATPSAVAGLDLHLDRSGSRVRDGVTAAIRDAIRTGRLAPGTRLPSSRALAGDLGVARNTVARAYAELIAEGWLAAHQGSGTVVSHRGADSVRAVATPPGRPGSRRLEHDLRPGHPDLSSFPRAEWGRAVTRALNAAPSEAFGYGDPRGRPELRQALAKYLARARGVRAQPCNIVVCSGAAQGLSLIAGALADAGVAAVAVEEFGLPTQRTTLDSAGLRCPPMTVDSHGADVRTLEATAMAGVGGVLLTASHQFPLGVSLHPERRAAVVAWARRTGGVVIEDDYDGEFRYDRSPVGALHGADPDHVVYLGTASKSLAPGLRLGWLVLPGRLVGAVLARKGDTEETCGVVDQLAMAEFVESGSYDRHIRTMRAHYGHRREQLVEAVATASPSTVVSGMPAGLHVTLELPGAGPTPRPPAWRRLGLESLELYRHPESICARDGLVVGFAAPAPSSWSAALAALTRLLP